MDNPALAAVSIYAGLSALILMWLSAATGRIRGQEKVSIGDGGNLRLIRAMRGHANAIETIPAALILLLIMALSGVSVWAIHLLGAALVLGRFLHALHFTQADAPGWQRGMGAGLSAAVLLVGGVWTLVLGLAASF